MSKDNMSLDNYVRSFLVRALWSLAISASSFYGLDIVIQVNNNNFQFDKRNIQFIQVFFGFTAVFELISIIFNIFLWVKQKKKEDLSILNQFDCKFMLILSIFRICFTFTLGIVILSNSNIVYVGTLSQWEQIQEVTIGLMVSEIIQIVLIAFSLLYLPDNFVRDNFQTQFDKLSIENQSHEFQDSVQKGIIPHTYVQKRYDDLKNKQMQKKIDAAKKLHQVRDQQKWNHIKSKTQREDLEFKDKNPNMGIVRSSFIRNIKNIENNQGGNDEKIEQTYEQYLDFKNQLKLQKKAESHQTKLKNLFQFKNFGQNQRSGVSGKVKGIKNQMVSWDNSSSSVLDDPQKTNLQYTSYGKSIHTINQIMNRDSQEQRYKINSIKSREKPEEIEIYNIKKMDENSEDENSKILNVENNEQIESPVIDNQDSIKYMYPEQEEQDHLNFKNQKKISYLSSSFTGTQVQQINSVKNNQEKTFQNINDGYEADVLSSSQKQFKKQQKKKIKEQLGTNSHLIS